MTEVSDNIDNLGMQEQMVPQSKVNEVVGREKLRVKAEMEARHQQELEAMKAKGGNAVNVEDIVAQTEARMMQKMEENRLEQQKQQYTNYLDNVAGNYINKMKAGPSLYEDFEAVTSDFDPKEFKDVLFLAHDLEELPDIVYELSQNTDKLQRLDYLAQKSPKMAKKEIQKLAESIKTNKQAKEKNPTTNPPLKNIRPSTAAGVGDSGKLGLKDLKKASWLRG